MNKSLMFDTEHGSHTLGGETEIQEMFNCPVLKPSTFEAFGSVIHGIFKEKEVIVSKAITKDLTIE